MTSGSSEITEAVRLDESRWALVMQNSNESAEGVCLDEGHWEEGGVSSMISGSSEITESVRLDERPCDGRGFSSIGSGDSIISSTNGRKICFLASS
jgi:hypothetical protein